MPAPPYNIRHAEPDDHRQVIGVINDWWGGRRMADMLPKQFFVHFRPTSFVAETAGRVGGFLVGFPSQEVSRNRVGGRIFLPPMRNWDQTGCEENAAAV